MTPTRLLVRLTIYFVAVFGLTILLAYLFPSFAEYVPINRDSAALPWEMPEFREKDILAPGSAELRVGAALFLIGYLVSTVLLMLPISWVYMAHKAQTGYRRNFVVMLIALPIAACTVVMLVQNNLALAFGLAAMVAAVRFRVALDDALDGGYIFAGIVIGLAAGINHVGVAAVMAVFFCYVITALWAINYGTNPVEEDKLQRKQAKRAAEDAEN